MSAHAYGGGFAGQGGRTSNEIRVPRGKSGPGLGHVPLVASEGVITVGDQGFRLADVDRVSYRAAVQINLAHYRIGVGQGGAQRTFMFDAYRRGTELDDTRDVWLRLVALLESTACPRIADDALRSIAAGRSVAFGSQPGSRIDADADGLRPRRPFARIVPWAEIDRADRHEGQVRVWTRSGRKPAMSTDMAGWNAVVLPRVVAALVRRTQQGG
jgi:hypothetical protein